MASKSKSTSKLRPHDVQVPPSPKSAPPGGQHRRSLPKGVERTAQVLVHEAGSVRKAKKAIDAAAEMEGQSEFREDQLAIRLGFPSRKELLGASKPVFDDAGEPWWATRANDGAWVVWNEHVIKSNKFATIEEAKQSFSKAQAGSEPVRADGEPAKSDAFPEGFNG
jgi:hypothetical protein